MIQTEVRTKRSFVDPFFKPGIRGSFLLSIQLGKDGLYAAVLDLNTNTFVALEEYLFNGIQDEVQLTAEFEKMLENPLMNVVYEKVIFGVISEFVSLIPEALYDEERKSDFFEFTHGRESGHKIFEDKMVGFKARNLYTLPSGLRDSVQRKFPFARIIHASTPLIEGLSLLYKQREGQVVAVHIQYSHFELLYFNNGVLNYYNSFSHTTAEDFIYYTLFVFEQLGLNAEKIPVEIYGETGTDSNVYNLLFKYVRFVSFGKRPVSLRYSPALDVLPPTHYFNLFQQYLCAS